MKGFIDQLFGSRDFQRTQEIDHPSTDEHLVRKKISQQNNSMTLQIIAGSAQSVGLQRAHNEDSLFTLTSNLANDNECLPIGIYIVADGMGGHSYGEIASEIAVKSFAKRVIEGVISPLLSHNPTPPQQSVQEIMRSAVYETHIDISKDAPGSGTTLTAVLILGDQMTIAHVGDSRAYSIGFDGQIEMLTRDHSYVTRLVELGRITEEEAAIHPQRNVLIRALGHGEPIDPDIDTIPTPISNYLLICSDGLWSVVPEPEIKRIIFESHTIRGACQALVDAANQAGGPDNITVILVQLPDQLYKK